MNLQQIDEYVNAKIERNEELLVFSFFELRVKNDLTEQDTDAVLNLICIKLNNLNYSIYHTGEKYSYNNQLKTVQQNELLVAIKNEKGESNNETNRKMHKKRNRII